MFSNGLSVKENKSNMSKSALSFDVSDPTFGLTGLIKLNQLRQTLTITLVSHHHRSSFRHNFTTIVILNTTLCQNRLSSSF